MYSPKFSKVVLFNALALHFHLQHGLAFLIPTSRSIAQFSTLKPGSPSIAGRNVIQMSSDVAELGLTPALEKIVQTFRTMPDDKYRYKQLLFIASNAPAMDASLMVPENKVQGCLSTVYVNVHPSPENDGTVVVEGDSDALMTKGLVNLLVRGLSGYTSDEIEKVQPEFIQFAGIAASLTPGRNNGFVNMLKTIKHKAKVAAESSSAGGDGSEGGGGGPIEQAVRARLTKMLKPSKLELTNKSQEHAGHAGNPGGGADAETHFDLYIVSDLFEGIPLVKRHQLVYALLEAEMTKKGGIHALSIEARTSEEAKK